MRINGMGAARPQQLSGPDSVFGADLLRQRMEARNDWPYPHIFPRDKYIPVNQISSALVPDVVAPATSAVVDLAPAYTVPEGFELELWGVMIDFEGIFIPGDSLFALEVNQPGFNDLQTTYVQGLINLPVPLGSWRTGRQWRFYQRYRFAPLDTLTWVCTNLNLSGGPPNAYVGGLFGFLLPGDGKS